MNCTDGPVCADIFTTSLPSWHFYCIVFHYIRCYNLWFVVSSWPAGGCLQKLQGHDVALYSRCQSWTIQLKWSPQVADWWEGTGVPGVHLILCGAFLGEFGIQKYSNDIMVSSCHPFLPCCALFLMWWLCHWTTADWWSLVLSGLSHCEWWKHACRWFQGGPMIAYQKQSCVMSQPRLRFASSVASTSHISHSDITGRLWAIISVPFLAPTANSIWNGEESETEAGTSEWSYVITIKIGQGCQKVKRAPKINVGHYIKDFFPVHTDKIQDMTWIKRVNNHPAVTFTLLFNCSSIYALLFFLICSTCSFVNKQTGQKKKAFYSYIYSSDCIIYGKILPDHETHICIA